MGASIHYRIPCCAGIVEDALQIHQRRITLVVEANKSTSCTKNFQSVDPCGHKYVGAAVASNMVRTLGVSVPKALSATHGPHMSEVQAIESPESTPFFTEYIPVYSQSHVGMTHTMSITFTRRSCLKITSRAVIVVVGGSSQNSDAGRLVAADNLTEFNTAHNRRISMLGISEDDQKQRRKRHKYNVSFKDEEDVINPEDVDPSVGRFRNLVQTTVVPTKKRRLDISGLVTAHSGVHNDHHKRHNNHIHRHDGLYGDLPPEQHPHSIHGHSMFSSLLSSKLGLPLPNPAPEVELAPPEPAAPEVPAHLQVAVDHDEPKKKKYAKEAWPGKKPTPSLLV
ncbi:unnamed protein product, partial [Meganyctiphanes norvegica]